MLTVSQLASGALLATGLTDSFFFYIYSAWARAAEEGTGGKGAAVPLPATGLGGGNISFCPPEILKGPQGKIV